MTAPDLLGQFSTSLIKEDIGIIEFAQSPKFLGMKLYPRQRTLLKIIFLEELDTYDKAVLQEWEERDDIELIPKLQDRIDYLKANGHPHFRTVQLIGGRRSSKGFLTAIAIAYKVYRMTQLESLSDHYGLERGKNIYASIVADSMEQAKAHQYADAFDAVVNCKRLQEQGLLGRGIAESLSIKTPEDIKRAIELKKAGVQIDRDMATIIVKAFGTNSKTIRGSASMLFIFDEMAHLIAGESRMSDEELWKASIPSLAQFRKDGLVFANSSPYTKTGKFFELYEQSLELDPPEDGKPVYPDHFMLKFPSWSLYEDWDRDPDIDIAGYNRARGPQILDPKDDPQLAREERADPDSFKVEYRAQFAEVLDAFLKPDMVDRMFDPAWNMAWLGRDLRPQAGAVGYVRYKGHGDPASVGANFGVAVAHIEDVENPETHIVEQHVVFDYIDAFYPEDFEDETIDWLQVVPTITQMINAFRPFEFTFDQFDSSMAIQQITQNLKQMGITESIVMPKFATPKLNDRRWKNFKSALYLGRVHAPHPQTFNPLATKNSIELGREELKRLHIKNGRVDKQTIGAIKTKDIADCIAECTDALIGDAISSGTYEALSSPPAFGSQGGFFIGKGNTSSFGEFEEWYATRPSDYDRRGARPAYLARGIRKPRRR